MRISDWSSDVCSSDLPVPARHIFALEFRDLLGGRHHRKMDGGERQIEEEGFSRRLRLVDETHGPIDPHVRRIPFALPHRSEEHTSELQSLMRISYAVFCLKKNINNKIT